MAKTLVITCDWCLEGPPILDASQVVVEGITLDLCKDHAAKWGSISASSGGGFRPRASAKTKAGVEEGSEGSAVEVGDLAPAKTRRERSAEFHARKKTPAIAKPRRSSGRATAVKGKVTKATKVTKPAKAGKASGGTGVSKNKELRASVDSGAVRAWAQSNGIAVPARGPLKASIIEQFLASPLNTRSKVPSASFTSAP